MNRLPIALPVVSTKADFSAWLWNENGTQSPTTVCVIGVFS